jgi:serine phosphatase RsbU (regulator of sigma subunit)
MLALSDEMIHANLTTHLESLRYAQLIQKSLLPKRRHFNRLVADHFVFYQPLHFVSGDFYWIGEKEGKCYIAVGDCTGHGVPGAMLSVLCRSILDYSIMTKGITRTDKALREMDKKFIESFYSIREESFNNDWVDIALVCIDRPKGKIHFSSANRKVLHVGESGVNLVEGSSYPIGGWQLERQRHFESVSFDYTPGDAIYLGSDGYQDQIGGSKTKKFSSKQLHQLLSDHFHLPMKEQRSILQSTYLNWKGKEDQIDDICVLGIRL